MSMTDRQYLSIGEVLALLKGEFPEVTISKIRFLEGEGLIEPERTTSGYRKFYDADVARLRVILREQSENYLPLRVIKERLDNGGIDDSGALTPPKGIRHLPATSPTTAAADDVDGDADSDVTGELTLPPDVPVPTSHHPAAKVRPIVPPVVAAADPPAPPPAPEQPSAPSGAAPGVRDTPPPSIDSDAGASSNPAAAFFARQPGGNEPNLVVFDSGPEQFTVNEICAHAGITNKQLIELESFGLVAGAGTGTTAVYSRTDLEVLRLCKSFIDRGVEPRHLRAWRQAVDREASLFEQLVLPLIRQRNPQSRQQAGQSLDELSRLGAALRAELLRSALQQYFDN